MVNGCIGDSMNNVQNSSVVIVIITLQEFWSPS